jgi:hypothetical protein
LALLAVASLALIMRAERAERRAALLPASLALAVIAAPVVLDMAGANYVLGRNLLPAWLPAAMVAAIALSTPRAGRTGAVAALVLVLAAAWPLAAVFSDRTLQRAALTAALVPQPLDPANESIEPRVGYAQGARAQATCPGRHVAVGGGASLLVDGPDEPLDGRFVSNGPRGWSAVAPSGGARRVSVYAICTAPLE